MVFVPSLSSYTLLSTSLFAYPFLFCSCLSSLLDPSVLSLLLRVFSCFLFSIFHSLSLRSHLFSLCFIPFSFSLLFPFFLSIPSLFSPFKFFTFSIPSSWISLVSAFLFLSLLSSFHFFSLSFPLACFVPFYCLPFFPISHPPRYFSPILPTPFFLLTHLITSSFHKFSLSPPIQAFTLPLLPLSSPRTAAPTSHSFLHFCLSSFPSPPLTTLSPPPTPHLSLSFPDFLGP